MTAESAGPEEAALQGADRSSPAPVKLDLAELGPPDLVMLGNGWSIPVHRQVLVYSVTLILLKCTNEITVQSTLESASRSEK